MTKLRTDICVATHKRDKDRQRRAADGLYLCWGCRDQLEQLVAEMPARFDELGRALHGGGGGGGQRVSGSSSEPAPINLAAAEHRQQIVHDLAWWCIYVADERGIARPTSSQPGVTATWLTTHIDWIAADRGAAEECLPVMQQLAGRARAICDPARRLPTGERCRVVSEDGERCDGVITMHQREDAPWEARCSRCGPQLPGAYMADSVDGRWVTIERVEAYALRVHGLRLSRNTVRTWAAREHIQAREEREKVWYELGSVDERIRDLKKRKEGRVNAHDIRAELGQ